MPVAVLLAIISLSACSFSPLYSNSNNIAQNQKLGFSDPKSRLEQIIYQRLTASFSNSSAADAILVTIASAQNDIEIGDNSVSLDATMTLYKQDPLGVGDPVAIYRTTRTATATYSTSPQMLANQQAANEAAERAATELGETMRLTLLSVLATLEQQGILAQPYAAALSVSAT